MSSVAGGEVFVIKHLCRNANLMCPVLYLSLAEPDSAFAGTAWKAVTQGEGAEVCARSAKTKLSRIISQATPEAPLCVLP